MKRILIASGIGLVKIWTDISKAEQTARLKDRHDDPLRALNVSDMDAVAQAKWDGYSEALDEMLQRASTAEAPWMCVLADHKKRARPTVIPHLLHVIGTAESRSGVEPAEPEVLLAYQADALEDWLAA